MDLTDADKEFDRYDYLSGRILDKQRTVQLSRILKDDTFQLLCFSSNPELEEHLDEYKEMKVRKVEGDCSGIITESRFNADTMFAIVSLFIESLTQEELQDLIIKSIKLSIGPGSICAYNGGIVSTLDELPDEQQSEEEATDGEE